MSKSALSRKESIDARDVRALTEHMTVLGDVGRARDADDLFLVVSESGSEYLVDAREGRCECADYEHRDAHCKHQRAVTFCTGMRPIPDGVDVDGINPQLLAAEFVDGEPQFPVRELEQKNSERAVATDGGQVLEAADAESDDDARPDECDCEPWMGDLDDPIPCWECYRAGFRTPNPDAEVTDE